MAYTAVTLPLTGTGDATAAPACDIVDSKAYQAMKLMDGAEGSTVPVPALGTTPGTTDHGLVVRPIGSTAHNQAIVGAVGLTSGSSEVALSSVGSTRLVGQVTVANPTTSVDVANPTTAVNVANQPTVDLSSVGSTRLVGRVDVNNPTTSVTISNPTTSVTVTNISTAVTVTNPTTAVTVSSGVVLGAGSTANSLGSVALLAGSTGNTVGAVAVTNPTTAVDLSSNGSTRFVGINNYESFTVCSRTSVASSADVSLFAANTAHRSRIVQNQSTGFELLLNLSTNVVTSGSSGSDIRIPINGYVVFGGQTGNFPLYVGAMRCKLASTTVNAVAVGLALTT